MIVVDHTNGMFELIEDFFYEGQRPKNIEEWMATLKEMRNSVTDRRLKEIVIEDIRKRCAMFQWYTDEKVEEMLTNAFTIETLNGVIECLENNQPIPNDLVNEFRDHAKKLGIVMNEARDDFKVEFANLGYEFDSNASMSIQLKEYLEETSEDMEEFKEEVEEIFSEMNAEESARRYSTEPVLLPPKDKISGPFYEKIERDLKDENSEAFKKLESRIEGKELDVTTQFVEKVLLMAEMGGVTERVQVDLVKFVPALIKVALKVILNMHVMVKFLESAERYQVLVSETEELL